MVESTIPKNRGKRIKRVLILGLEMDAFIDNGSDLNLIREDAYKKIGSPELTPTNQVLKGFPKATVCLPGSFSTKVTVENLELEVELYVVPDWFDKEVIFGDDFINLVDVRMNRKGITITKFEEEAATLMRIAAVDVNALKIAETASRENRAKVLELVSNYKPEKTKSTAVKMTIKVKEEKPVYMRPRQQTQIRDRAAHGCKQVWLRCNFIAKIT